MKKSIAICLVAAAAAGIAGTQLTLFTIGTESTHLLARTGMARNMPFFASDEQHCAGAGTASWMCERAAAAFVPGGPHHLLAMPYMGFVRSLSIALSSDV